MRPKKIMKGKNLISLILINIFFDQLNINDKNSVICVLNNNPFIKSKLIKKSFKLFKKFKYKRIISDYAKVDGDYISPKQFFKKNQKNKIF